MFLILWLLAYSGNVTELVTRGYWESVTAQSTFLLVWTAPAVAACGAWEGTRVRRSAVLEGAPTRSPVAVALTALAPTLLLGGLSVALAVSLLAPQAMGYPGWPSLPVMALQLLVVAAHTVVGYVLGLSALRALAVPVALVGSFLWMAYPAALPAFWVRQLNGTNIAECCAIDQTVATRGIIAPAVVAMGMIAAAWLWSMRRRLYQIPAVVALGSLIATGAWIAQPLGYAAAQDRPAAERSCTGAEPRVCLWPEQRRSAAEITRWAGEAHDRLEAAGISVRAEITPMSAAPRRDDVIGLVAFGVLPNDIPACASRGDWPGNLAFGPLHAWLSLTAGVDPVSLAGRYIPQEVEIAERVRELPQPAQQEWFQRNAPTLTVCDQHPNLDPAHYL
ncbi:hypothetical protein [Streptomyces sp. PT12]|uniref:DUF7224 domain-containing protein n=1 Tax=Streptomyces sp. PT12 TaxID=1510197 RepID=UPI0011BE8C77|nr:hypothetical protein [Streptomyces sp. PT12]